MIHRDIKPQNVVVDSWGCCHFIDMGISRFYGKDKRNDTMIMGTRITAPPEQFGYQQTDICSDLYSLGILLHYCITGDYEISDQTLQKLEPGLQKIIQKATMFDPDKRYQTTEELLWELLAARYHPLLPHQTFRWQNSRTIWRITACILLILNLVLTGTLIHEKTKQPKEVVTNLPDSTPAFAESYTFREPLIEEAARKILNIPEGPVTVRDLEKITSLHIMGLWIYSDDSEIRLQGNQLWIYDNEARESGLYLQTGPISSLEDITHMQNLKTLSLYRQQISDISALKDTRIENLGLGYNPLTDLSPLEGNPSIRSLNLAALELSDVSALSGLSGLERLNISDTEISSVSGLRNCSISELNLFGIDLVDYGELRDLPSLETLLLDQLNPDILEKLEGLSIRDLTFYYSSGFSLDSLSVLTDLETLYFNGDSQEYLNLSEPRLPKLRFLNLYAVKLRDFHQLSSLTALTTLHLYGADCESYEGLDELPSLRYINATSEQEEAIRARFPEGSFSFKLLR